jgi:hypothetical protein
MLFTSAHVICAAQGLLKARIHAAAFFMVGGLEVPRNQT